jgi:hypothetical protein
MSSSEILDPNEPDNPFAGLQGKPALLQVAISAARKLILPEYQRILKEKEFNDEVQAVGKLLEAGLRDNALVKLEVCLKRQQQLIFQGRKIILASDIRIVQYSEQLGIPNLPDNHPLRELYEQNQDSLDF